MAKWRRHRSTGAIAIGFVLAIGGGCSSVGLQDEIDLGREFVRHARREFEFLQDPDVRDFVAGIGASLLRASKPQPYRYRFYVVVDETPNAFAAPGGHVFIHTGALLAAQDCSQVAAILAHEMGHVVHRHVIRMGDLHAQQVQRQAIADARRASHGGPPRGPFGALMDALHASSFSQEQEMEADAFGVEALRAAGYCPRALVPILATIAKTRTPSGALASHPPTPQRVEAILARSKGVESCNQVGTVADERLFAIQERVVLLTRQRDP